MLTCLFYPLSKPVSPGKNRHLFAKEPAAKIQKNYQFSLVHPKHFEIQRNAAANSSAFSMLQQCLL
jgi:hypothetical protein